MSATPQATNPALSSAAIAARFTRDQHPQPPDPRLDRLLKDFLKADSRNRLFEMSLIADEIAEYTKTCPQPPYQPPKPKSRRNSRTCQS